MEPPPAPSLLDDVHRLGGFEQVGGTVLPGEPQLPEILPTLLQILRFPLQRQLLLRGKGGGVLPGFLGLQGPLLLFVHWSTLRLP